MTVRIQAQRLYLRELEPTDAGRPYLEWMRDPVVTRFLEARFEENDEESLRRYVTAQRDDPSTLLLAIVLIEGDRHIGNVKLGPIDRNHLSADIGILIGDRGSWGLGYASEAIAALSSYAFAELGLRKLTAGSYAPNVGSIRAFEKAGFRREGLQSGQYVCEGERVDGVLLGRLAAE